MLKSPELFDARDILLSAVCPVETERLELSRCAGRILAQDLTAQEDIPPFDRSPYDGYAFRSADTLMASAENPVTFRILEEVPAGNMPSCTVTEGTAVKLLTGSPIPPGADAVINYERTGFTESTVTLFSPLKPGENIIYTGEDVRKGETLARCGDEIDPGTAGTLAAQGMVRPCVYQIPRVGIISTGNEVTEADSVPENGKIRNSNRYTLEAALYKNGFEPVYLGLAGDSASDICALIKEGISRCDALISTGGVSVGDYDLTADAMELAGAEMLFSGVKMKPGMACAYGVSGGKPICALSGNPASCITNFYALALPALKKLAGRRAFLPQEISLRLSEGFRKGSPVTRLLRGTLIFGDGLPSLRMNRDQGNVVLSSTIGCNAMAVIPGGSGPIAGDAVLNGFMI